MQSDRNQSVAQVLAAHADGFQIEDLWTLPFSFGFSFPRWRDLHYRNKGPGQDQPKKTPARLSSALAFDPRRFGHRIAGDVYGRELQSARCFVEGQLDAANRTAVSMPWSRRSFNSAIANRGFASWTAPRHGSEDETSGLCIQAEQTIQREIL